MKGLVVILFCFLALKQVIGMSIVDNFEAELQQNVSKEMKTFSRSIKQANNLFTMHQNPFL